MGKSTAKLLAENGTEVVFAARREELLKTIIDEIKTDNGDAATNLIFQQKICKSCQSLQ
ncbi:hypothetical protein [Metabacillus sp. RGM 3146]|uniref:hypothetical protein n=1 Tax=Metabacillus sp. RGM 3146 TaxID=3401092 RepID=UPI003B9ABF6C